MQWTLEDWKHEYNAIPWAYPIGDNNSPATFDQFIKLRDVLIFSNKYYADKAWRSLIIWTKLDWTPTDTIEIREPNLSKMSFEPWYTSSSWISDETQGTYIESWHQWSTNPLSCTIKKKWRYKIYHKEQFVDIDPNITRIHTFVLQHHWNLTISRAVFDNEWTQSWLFNRMTAYGYVECDLDAWDWLEFKMLDQDDNPIDSATWRLWQNANWRSVEYLDLAYNI